MSSVPSDSSAPDEATNAGPPSSAGASPAKSPTSSAKPASSQSAENNIKETIESILVAFILAFVFRAFVVEAFVIPTGSMAPTLMGAHMRFRCPDCGYSFDVNFNTGKPDDTQIPDYAQTLPTEDPKTRKVTPGYPIVYDTSPAYQDPDDHRVFASPIYCPNCGHQVPATSVTDPENDASGPPVYYGDRILVLKYLYLFQAPRRWDVVVFKAPVADMTPPNTPKAFHYTENYIKRLVGLPGETILILDGDVYSKAPGAATFTIQRKPYSVQKDLWRVVYDNDFIPHGLSRPTGAPWAQPWISESGKGWDLTAPGGTNPDKNPSRAFQFHNDAGGGALTFDPTVNPAVHALTDWLPYDQTGNAGNDFYPVNDLDLTCYYQRKSGDGPFSLQLTKGPDVFTARIVRGRAQLLHSHTNPDGTVSETTPYDVPVPALDGSRPVRLEFANCDYRVWLRVDGEEVFATTDAQYSPEWTKMLQDPQWQQLLSRADWQDQLNYARPELGHPEWVELARKQNKPQPGTVRILAEKQEATVEHLRLSRDIYYINQATRYQPLGGPVWGSPPNPITLRGGPLGKPRGESNEYFVLGDNSRISGDARMWADPVSLPAERLFAEPGRVPEQFMLGKAFFVYWPAGYRPFSKSFGQEHDNLNPGIIPNFGDMRSIH